ncbi:NAD-dependent epimerase/dehydratase family protein [Sphingomonas sp. 37zxx]|uniref:NAD-dependent epimerase/dehydratase family protein n=1 Tax=Sphingomonas sp. 37zxx TaxID=1550073 RepID=UPI00053BEDBB|nr:NAD(P)-dependent oxidoreductase [Sphingomonas sp. 37zxx]
MTVLAITGGTGFVGSRLITQALADGHKVRALTRRPQPPREGVTWIEGALDRPGTLCAGVDAVIHVAGVVNARDRAGFVTGNIDGTRTILDAAASAGIERFIHVSSLAAREPDLSTYGWSKAQGEALVRASDREWDVVRPPAVYGPGDMEMREMFRLATRRVMPLPPPGKLSILHVDDLVRLLLALVRVKSERATYEVDDETPEAWTHESFARALGQAVGQRVMPLSLPRPLLSFAAKIARALQGDEAKLTPDRVAYFCHPDWTAHPDRRPPAALWQPRISAAQGLPATAQWYRDNALL